MILEKLQSGATQKDIALELGVSTRTIRRALKRGSQPLARKNGVRTRKLEPFEPQIHELIDDNVWNASVIFRKLKQSGYEGGYTAVRDFVQPLRKQRAKPGTVRFETAAGKQLQHDWGEKKLLIGGVLQTAYLAVNTLGFSRALHVVAMPRLDANHTYQSLMQSFVYFGGVTSDVLVDNQKAAVLNWCDGKPVFNPRFRELGRHYGFVPKACRPRRAQTKGKVERMVRYVKENALCGDSLSFDSFAELNNYLTHWCDTVANVRVHADLKERVDHRWRLEHSTLQQLPSTPFDTNYRVQRQVALESWVHYEGNRYSVPSHLVSETVEVVVSLDGRLTVWHKSIMVAAHMVCAQSNQSVITAEHHNALWADLKVDQRSLSEYDERCA